MLNMGCQLGPKGRSVLKTVSDSGPASHPEMLLVFDTSDRVASG